MPWQKLHAPKPPLWRAMSARRASAPCLNLGHTFGHAFEKLTGYGEALLHGEAVAYGMVLAFAYSAQARRCSAKDADRLRAHIGPAACPQACEASAMAFRCRCADRRHGPRQKSARRQNAFILARGLGDSFIADNVDAETLRSFPNRARSTRLMTAIGNGLLWTAGLIIFLLILSAFLSGSETALTATSKARMLRLQQEGRAAPAG
jgi:hypothetical protein